MATNKSATTCNQQFHIKTNCELVFIAPVSEQWGVGSGHLSRSLKLIDTLRSNIHVPTNIVYTLVTQSNKLSDNLLSNYKDQTFNLITFDDELFLKQVIHYLSTKTKSKKIVLIVDSPYEIKSLSTIENIDALLSIETKQNINCKHSKFYSLNNQDYKDNLEWIQHIPFYNPGLDYMRGKRQNNEFKFDILILSGGGHDPSGIARKIIESTRKLDLDIACRINPECLDKTFPNDLTVFEFVEDIFKLLSQSKLIVTSGGLTFLEAYSFGNKILAYPSIKKEELIIKELIKIDDHIYLWDESFSWNNIIQYIDQNTSLNDISRNRINLFGFKIVVENLLELINSV